MDERTDIHADTAGSGTHSLTLLTMSGMLHAVQIQPPAVRSPTTRSAKHSIKVRDYTNPSSSSLAALERNDRANGSPPRVASVAVSILERRPNECGGFSNGLSYVRRAVELCSIAV